MKKSTVFATLFAVIGLGGAAWMVAGPAVGRWWNRPDPEPVVHEEVVTGVAEPEYATFTAADALSPALEQVESAIRSTQNDHDPAWHGLSSDDRDVISHEVASALRPLLTGSSDDYLVWVRALRANHPALVQPEGEPARKVIAQWETIAEGFTGSPIDTKHLRVRLRYKDGQGPFEAPEDEIRAGYSVSTDRFPGLASDPKVGRLTIFEAIVPVMYVDKQTGTASNTMLGFWMARAKPGEPWRLWRIAMYDFERPSRAFVPVY